MLLGEGDIKTKLIYLAMYVIAIVVSLSFHEWAHAFAAHRMGDDTARNMGRMTINPLAHLDPMGFIMLLVIGFGWAKPVPVNPRNYRNYRVGEFIVSFAGIFTNLMIALFAALASCVVAAFDLKAGGNQVVPILIRVVCFQNMGTKVPFMLYEFFYILGILNCALAVFNFIPVFPLDGSHIFDLIFGKLVGAKAIMWLHANGRYILYGFLILSVLLSRTAGISLIGDTAYWIYDKFHILFEKLVSLVF